LTPVGCQGSCFHAVLVTLGQVTLPPRGAAARGPAESAPPAPSLLRGKRAAARLTPAWSHHVGHDVTRCGGTPPRAARRRPPRWAAHCPRRRRCGPWGQPAGRGRAAPRDVRKAAPRGPGGPAGGPSSAHFPPGPPRAHRGAPPRRHHHQPGPPKTCEVT
jgi:hypothetical protein